MHLRPLRTLTALAIATSLFGAASTALAGPKDKEAQKLFDAAINEDYLNAEFPKAEKKLKDAVSKCGDSGCSPELLGKIQIALGTVYGVGLSKADEAKKAFIAALKADPKAALDPSLTTPELTKIFEDAKKSAGSSGGGGGTTPKPASPSGDAQHQPPPESAVNTPLPIYIEPTDEVPLSKVVLRYKPFGGTQYKSVELKKMGKGYGGEIPCEDVTTTGDVKYFFAFTGSDGEPAGGLGSSKEPFRTTIKNEIEGEAPKLPGKKPPTQCKAKEDCPPGLPGCEDKKSSGGPRGDKGWGATCEKTQECKEGLMCLNGSCEEDKGGGGGDNKGDSGKKKRMNLVSVGVQFDLLNITGADAVCSGNSEAATNHACFYPGTSNQFYGVPNTVGSTNGIQGGLGFADVRIIAGYDRQILKDVGLSVGARIGFAIGGSPTPANAPPPGYSQALPFIPFHGELRVSYHFLGSMMEDKKFRPYAFINPIGFGQVNASVPVTVCDTSNTPATTKTCPGGNGYLRELNAYQITGRTFSGFGVGTTFGITPLFGLSVEAKLMFMWPTFGIVVAPTIGPVFAF